MTDENTAVAVKYVRELPAPFIVAKGKRELAARLLKIARENGVEIVSEPELSKALYEFQVGSFIPEQMYEIIAHILAHVLKVRKSL
ncbi:MAG: EscU/YscU/HrcU family type III secretion system export apparatus switch protein [Spirochaetales bacterium]|nr:EscU/YscU/HrcU family type III secretion system export apparatus switch protein [Spirochaetales bacterium]